MERGPERPLPPPAQHYVDSPRFEVEFSHYWSQLSLGLEDFHTEHELSELRDKAYEKEINFYFKVYDQVNKVMRATNGEVICLFDIDGTIAEMKDEYNPDSHEIHMLLRPTFTNLIAQLAVENPEILRFGLISLRPLVSLIEEADNPTFLGVATAYLDENLLFSSAYTTRTDPLMGENTDPRLISEFLITMRGFLDDALLDATATGSIDFYDWYDPKLKLMAQLHAGNPDKTYIFVDNQPYVGHINSGDVKIAGICVQDEEQLLLG